MVTKLKAKATLLLLLFDFAVGFNNPFCPKPCHCTKCESRTTADQNKPRASACQHIVNITTLANCEGQQLQTIPRFRHGHRVTHLSLVRNFLHELSASDIAERLEKLKNSLEFLDLSVNRFDKGTGTNAFRTLTNLRELYLENSEIQNLQGGFLHGIGNLEILSLQNNRISKLSTGDFEGLGKLEWLSLEQNNLSEIEPNTMIGLPRLRHLSLAFNRLRKIRRNALSGLLNLESLDVSYNRLGAIGLLQLLGEKLNSLQKLNAPTCEVDELVVGAFTNYTNLIKLNLDNNQLQSILHRSFNGLDNLSVLVLSRNRIHYIDEDVWRGTPALKQLDLSANRLDNVRNEMFSALKMLLSLNLARNHINRMDKNALSGLSSLRELDMSYNKLDVITRNTFKELVSIETITLSENVISEIQAGAFTKMSRLKTLNLRKNQITLLNKCVFCDRIGDRIDIVLEENRLNCDCRMAWMIEDPKKQEQVHVDYDARCRTPRQFEKLRILQVATHLRRCSERNRSSQCHCRQLTVEKRDSAKSVSSLNESSHAGLVVRASLFMVVIMTVSSKQALV